VKLFAHPVELKREAGQGVQQKVDTINYPDPTYFILGNGFES